MKRKKSAWKVGVTRTVLRTINKKRRKCRVTKMSKTKYKTRVLKRR